MFTKDAKGWKSLKRLIERTPIAENGITYHTCFQYSKSPCTHKIYLLSDFANY